MSKIKIDIETINNFFDKVNKKGPIPEHCPELGRCYIFTGYTNSEGYGSFWYNKKLFKAHRFAYLLKYGPIPEGKLVCHKCDNTSCVRPKHLFIGTHLDNTRDCIKKGRIIFKTGELHGMAFLTEEQVLKIRKLYKTGNYTQTELAKRFGVGQNHISRIILKQAWNCI